jgi:peptidoglycan hydrolase-like protein with peptidoglycan-binding domain
MSRVLKGVQPKDESGQPSAFTGNPELQGILNGKETLRQGDKGEAVKVIQTTLLSLSYDLGRADGDFGPATDKAVRALQTDRGLKPDGIVGKNTLSALQGGGSSAASKKQSSDGQEQADEETREAEQEPAVKTLSGASWVSRFPTSKSLDDLESTFGANVKKFIKAMEDAGATVKISATKRPPERAYLMHWAWKIVKQKVKPENVPAKEEVDINWNHGDEAKSRLAAQKMLNNYGIKSSLKVPSSLTSRHIQGKAIDMTISWSDELKIKNADGTEQTITSTPQDGTNEDLIKVGKAFSVIHFINAKKDAPHWSKDGR